MSERVAEPFGVQPDGGMRFVRWGEKVVRCRDCEFCHEFAQGMVCTLRGSAGYFATEPQGFCWLGKEKE